MAFKLCPWIKITKLQIDKSDRRDLRTNKGQLWDIIDAKNIDRKTSLKIIYCKTCKHFMGCKRRIKWYRE